MEEKKYTQGKWEIYLGHDSCFKDEPYILTHIREGFPDRLIAHIIRSHDAIETKANAELIARAPELDAENQRLKELNKELVEALRWFIGNHLVEYEYLDKGISIATQRGKTLLSAREVLALAEKEA